MSSTGAFQYWQRTILHAGPGTVIRLPGLFSGLGGRRILLVSDQGLQQAGIVDKVANLFDGRQLPGGPQLCGIFTGVSPDAESSSIDAALRVARELGADSLLALGGGSVLDSTKLIKMALHYNVSSVSELLKSSIKKLSWPEVEHMGIPHIAVPTTAGTGAELTNGAVVLNAELGIKHLIFSDYLEADIAVLDAHMTTGLPPLLTAATALDALTHAVETISHTNANPFSLAHATMSARLILENLPKAVVNGTDVMARQALLNASAMACNSVVNDFGASPVHNVSHAVGTVCHIHHGEANGVLLPIVLEQFADYYVPVVGRLKETFGVVSGDGPDAVLACAAAISNFLEEVGHPKDFSRHNIPESMLPDICSAVASDSLAAFLPIPPKVVESICRAACGKQ